ncbi:Riboflavin biosynthesis protein RibD [Pseudodesulfovibrio piezophilus C1TLV30]|uniref:Riboflavin biosynthesis protein RibD n=2 Tax=Pseudodesulfovibrio TaxID=2035811 RepID=M1WK26_PSEP2|nr:Riboflavin biosynthesis protein RibD [Pseudodesulfovibrio piezophilus C1TLV30]
MACAIELATLGRGTTAPNPCVGAVLVREGHIVAGGWHKKYGHLHAERECLADAEEKNIDPRGLTLFVTLEPCNHHGKTPPCTQAIIEAGIKTVVIGTRDPNPLAAGGIETLQEHGITVKVGILEQECRDLIADFLLWQRSYSTYNIIKMAATLDGKIASRQHKPEPVSCPESFERVHRLRSMVNAVVVGGGTFYADNPSLSCRLDGLDPNFRQPLAVIVSSRLPAEPQHFTLLRQRPEKTIFFTSEKAAHSPEADALRKRGTSVWSLNDADGCFNLSLGFERLRYDHQCHYTLIEGGGRLAMECISQGLADKLIHFVTPRILGDDLAPSAYSGRQNVSMAETVNYRITQTETSGQDVVLTMLPRQE